MDRLPTSTSDSAIPSSGGRAAAGPCASANPSLEWTRSGTAPLPRGAVVHVAPRGQGAMPARAPSAQTLGSANGLRPCGRIFAAGRQFVARTGSVARTASGVSSSDHPPETAVLASIPSGFPSCFSALSFSATGGRPRAVSGHAGCRRVGNVRLLTPTAWSARALSRWLCCWAAACAMAAAVFLGATFFARVARWLWALRCRCPEVGYRWCCCSPSSPPSSRSGSPLACARPFFIISGSSPP